MKYHLPEVTGPWTGLFAWADEPDSTAAEDNPAFQTILIRTEAR